MSWFPEFESPDRLWALLLIPVFIVVYLIFLRMKKRFSMRFTNTGLLKRVARSQRRWTRHVAVALSLSSLAVLTLAWAEPLGVDKVRRERATIILMIDVSQSMQATDVAPSRLEAAKQEARRYVESLPEGYNVALIELSGSPNLRMPPSVDRGVVLRAIDALTLSDGTAIGDAIAVALDALRLAPDADGEKGVPALAVILSDGANTDGADPLAAADQAKDILPIYSIAYGTENGYVDIDGKREPVPPDYDLLEQIAQRTKGKSVSADSAQALRDAYQELDSAYAYEDVKKPITGQYVLVALAFAILAAVGAVLMASRWPR